MTDKTQSNTDPSSTSSNANTMGPIQQKQEQSNQSLEIRNSSELFNSLVAIVNGLRESISKLENENAGLRQELSILQQNCGAAFTLFQKLPPELRRRVWHFTYRSPQLHIINDNGASRSKLNSVFNSCLEAREVGLSLKLDYFLYGNRVHYIDGTKATGTIRNYINVDLDTLWITSPDVVYLLPEDIQWLCGKCSWFFDVENLAKRGHQGCGKGCISSCYESNLVFRRIAINFPSWISPGDSDTFAEGSMLILIKHKVLELLLIVGEFENLLMDRDVSFVTPARRPDEVKHAMSDDEKKKPGSFRKTWPQMEEEIIESMRSLKAQRAKERKHIVETGQATLEEMDDPENEWDDFQDLSEWRIPKVRFVEVRRGSRDWILPPKENVKSH